MSVNRFSEQSLPAFRAETMVGGLARAYTFVPNMAGNYSYVLIGFWACVLDPVGRLGVPLVQPHIFIGSFRF